jgi:hypothetical protein
MRIPLGEVQICGIINTREIVAVHNYNLKLFQLKHSPTTRDLPGKEYQSERQTTNTGDVALPFAPSPIPFEDLLLQTSVVANS